MKAEELRKKTLAELHALLKEKRERLYHLRVELSQGKNKNLKEYRQTKKDIARILTVINERRHQKQK